MAAVIRPLTVHPPHLPEAIPPLHQVVLPVEAAAVAAVAADRPAAAGNRETVPIAIEMKCERYSTVKHKILTTILDLKRLWYTST